jgi:hypothetical protein
VKAWLLMVTTPARKRAAIRWPRATSFVHTLAVRPYFESLARVIASSSSATTRMGRTGPNVSSRITSISCVTSVSTVGG